MSTLRASSLATLVALMAGTPSIVAAQDQEPSTRAAVIEQEQADKGKMLKPYQPNAGEQWAQKAQDILINGGLHWHPFFQSAYRGGGFTLGGGYRTFVSPYNLIDVRGSYTISNYKRFEAEFV